MLLMIVLIQDDCGSGAAMTSGSRSGVFINGTELELVDYVIKLALPVPGMIRET